MPRRGTPDRTRLAKGAGLPAPPQAYPEEEVRYQRTLDAPMKTGGVEIE
jgi:hypothetical protein